MRPEAPEGTRRTAQKRAIRGALEEAGEFVSAQQLHQRLDEAGVRVGLATVYRQLAGLAAAGLADTISVASGQLYRACESAEHHHHLVCETCGKAVEIDPPETWIRTAARKHGYTVTGHILEVFGRCPECAAA